MSKRPASEPPIWRWIVTAVTTNVRLLGADALGHVEERIVHRLAELRLGEHALELVRGRLGAFVDDRLDSLAEAVAGFQRRGQRDEHVRQLVLEPAQPAASLPRDIADRHGEADAHQDQRHDRGGARGRRDDGHRDGAARGDREQLAGPKRQVGTLDQALEPLELLDVGEDGFDARRPTVCASRPGTPGAEPGRPRLAARDVRLDAPCKPAVAL